MKIDFSAASAFAFCPASYQEKYQQGWRSTSGKESLDFGGRMHDLLKGHFTPLIRGNEGILGPQGQPLGDELLENEALEMFESYKAQYPIESFEVLDVEKYFEVPIPETNHVLMGKWDGLIAEGSLRGVFEHKTEKRGGKNNLPKSWAARNLVGLYLWAAQQVYRCRFDHILLDVLTRRSPAGRVPCCFRRDILQRTEGNLQRCVDWIVDIADRIEECEEKYGTNMLWPMNGDNCCRGGWDCEFYLSHVIGEVQVVQLEELVRNKWYEKPRDYLHS